MALSTTTSIIHEKSGNQAYTMNILRFKHKSRMSRGSQWKPIIHLCCIIMISYFLSQMSRKIVTFKKVQRFRTDMRHILLWSKIPNLEGSGQEPFLKRKCPHTNCYVIANRTFFSNLGYYDAVLFTAQDASAGGVDLPDARSWPQKYIFVANDSSDNYPVCDPVYDSFFNWTWTYKQDSTIRYRFISYKNNDDDVLRTRFKWINKMNPTSPYVQGQLISKYKAAAIFMDKCTSRSKREVYIDNLRRHLAKYNLSVDIFGECGPKKCKRKTMVNCFWRLKHHYYFYLAMEDSLALDYITKEVLYAYQNYAVPIVYGGGPYNDYLPPKSYLNANELDEKEMAVIINKSIQNRTTYIDFFRWRNHYSIHEGQGLDPCSICKALNNPHWLKYRTKNLGFRKWWNPMYKERCAETLNLAIPFS